MNDSTNLDAEDREYQIEYQLSHIVENEKQSLYIEISTPYMLPTMTMFSMESADNLQKLLV
jgi:hypothetical protein